MHVCLGVSIQVSRHHLPITPTANTSRLACHSEKIKQANMGPPLCPSTAPPSHSQILHRFPTLHRTMREHICSHIRHRHHKKQKSGITSLC